MLFVDIATTTEIKVFNFDSLECLIASVIFSEISDIQKDSHIIVEFNKLDKLNKSSISVRVFKFIFVRVYRIVMFKSFHSLLLVYDLVSVARMMMGNSRIL